MPPSSRRRWYSLAFLAILSLGIWATHAAIKGDHLANSQCTNCHLAQKDLKADNASVLVASQEDLCISCHPDSVRLSHPSGFPPGRDMPDGMPLDWKGDLTCSTCHNVHGKDPGLLKSKERGFAFCRLCHSDSFFDDMPDRGESMVLSGHLDARADKGEAVLDTFSIQCMTCHADKSNGLVTLSGNGVMRHDKSAMNHPIGGRYEANISFGGYKSKERLPDVVVLPDGKLSCISCHVGYSKVHGGLVVSNAGSGLCLTCHDL